VLGALSALAVVAIRIHASGDCPTAADIERELAPLLGDAAPASDVATLARAEDGRLSLVLDDAAGRPIGERVFPRARTCRDDAQTVAVALAIWEARLHPEITLRLDQLPPEPAPAPSEATTVRREAPPAVAPTKMLSLGVAAAGDWQAGAVVPAARLELAWGRADGRWRARVAALGVAPHARDFGPGPGRVSWWRATLVLGADVDLVAGRRVALVAGVGVAAGLVSISGSGFAVDRVARSLDAGGELRLRVEGRGGRVRPWAGLSILGWARRQALEIGGTPEVSDLPRLEPMAAAGAEVTW
jgi:hypothetical protein